MAKKSNDLNIFIASPGDTTAERDIVCKICTTHNQRPLVKDKAVRLSPTSWEDVMPQAGDPQKIINKLANDCDLLICLFHRQFDRTISSQPAGNLELFLYAYDQWRDCKKPQIFLYFKQVSIRSKEEREDPQLIRVMDFKARVEKDGLILYREFKDTDDFTELLKTNLEQSIIFQAAKDDYELTTDNPGRIPSASIEEKKEIKKRRKTLISIPERELLYKETNKMLHPCIDFRIEDLDWQVVKNFAKKNAW